MDGIYATGNRRQAERVDNSFSIRKVKRFDFSNDDNELLVMNIGDDTHLRLLGTGDDLMVDIRKYTKSKYHKSGTRVSAKSFKQVLVKLLDELNDIEAKERERKERERREEAILRGVRNHIREDDEEDQVPYKAGQKTVIVYNK